MTRIIKSWDFWALTREIEREIEKAEIPWRTTPDNDFAIFNYYKLFRL